MTRPRVLDLFCGAGGAAVGYHRAGFEVVGVDHLPQPRYPFEFHEADAMTFPLDDFDVVHASPPCQRYSQMSSMPNVQREERPDLIVGVRRRLTESGLRWVIENVYGAPLVDPIMLCGSMFGLGVRREGMQLRRHRYFEASPALQTTLACRHSGGVIGVYGGHARNRRRRRGSAQRGRDFPAGENLALAREAMGIDWMTLAELSEAIPPAYTEWIGKQLLRHLEEEANGVTP